MELLDAGILKVELLRGQEEREEQSDPFGTSYKNTGLVKDTVLVKSPSCFLKVPYNSMQ